MRINTNLYDIRTNTNLYESIRIYTNPPYDESERIFYLYNKSIQTLSNLPKEIFFSLNCTFPNTCFTEIVTICHENPVKCDVRANRVVRFEGS